MTLIYLPDETALGSHNIAANCNGDRILVGSPYDRHGNNAGAVFVLDANAGDVLQTIRQPCPQRDDNFGASLALNCDGTRVLIGARKGYGSNSDVKSPGVVYLYKLTQNGEGETARLLHIFHNPDPQDFDEFGSILDMDDSGSLLAMASPHHDENAGVVYLYGQHGTLFRTIRPPIHNQERDANFNINDSNQHRDKFFGTSVSMSGDGESIVIGAPGKGWRKQLPGAAYLFSTSSGDLIRTITNPTFSMEDVDDEDTSGTQNDYFASTVSISQDGSRMVIGAMLTDKWEISDQQSSKAGMAYFFNSDGKLLSTMTSPFHEFDDHFGISVSISANGDFILVGAPRLINNKDSNVKATAAALLFDRRGKLIKAIQSPAPPHGSKEDVQFGGSVVLTPSMAIISSAYHPAIQTSCITRPDGSDCPLEFRNVLKPMAVQDEKRLAHPILTPEYTSDPDYSNAICDAVPALDQPIPPFRNKGVQESFMIASTMIILSAMALIASRLYVQRRSLVVRTKNRTNNGQRIVDQDGVNLQSPAEDFPTTPRKAALPEII